MPWLADLTPDHFPKPVTRLTSKSPLWDGFEATEWLHAQFRIDGDAVINMRIVNKANRCLKLLGATGRSHAEAGILDPV
jgi:hypothetical protein